MEITADWLSKVIPVNGAWTKGQIEALGLKYPLKKGWKEEIIGSEITEENARIVANSRTKRASNKQRNIVGIKLQIMKLAQGLDDDSIADVILLLRSEIGCSR